MSRPIVRILYGSEGSAYSDWVRRLANRLRIDGVVAVFYRDLEFEFAKVADREAFVEQTLRVDRVVVLCSPAFLEEWDSPLASRILERLAPKRIVPVLAEGIWEEVSPEQLRGLRPINLSRPETFEVEYEALVKRLGGAVATRRSLPEPEAASELATGPPPREQAHGDALDGLGEISPELARKLLEELKQEQGAGADRSGPPPVENVQVTAVSPTAVKPGARLRIEVVFHVEGFEVEAAEGQKVDANVATMPLREGARLTVRLVSVDEGAFAIDDPEAPVVWAPPSRQVDFRLRAAKRLEGGVYDLRLEIWCGEVQLARTYLEVMVDRGFLARTSQPSISQRALPRSAFASYAHADKAEVAGRVDSLKAVGIDVFLDGLDIRQGKRWQGVLEGELLSRDALLLFWSSAARASRWVEKEWRFALERHGLEAILPNALEPADTCPPPPELASLQFGSVLTELAEKWRREAPR